MPYDKDGKYIVGRISFDPEAEMIRVKGSKKPDYLQVKHRLIMLRDMFPEAKHEEFLLVNDFERNIAIVQAKITLPPMDLKYPDVYTVGMGLKSESKADFGDYIEKAATGAMGRALYAAGIGAQYSQYDMEYESQSEKDFIGVDGPVSTNNTTKRTKENLRTQLKNAVDKMGVDAVKDHVSKTYNVSSSAELTDEQIMEVIAWAK